jgi:hypothetical protein
MKINRADILNLSDDGNVLLSGYLHGDPARWAFWGMVLIALGAANYLAILIALHAHLPEERMLISLFNLAPVLAGLGCLGRVRLTRCALAMAVNPEAKPAEISNLPRRYRRWLLRRLAGHGQLWLITGRTFVLLAFSTFFIPFDKYFTRALTRDNLFWLLLFTGLVCLARSRAIRALQVLAAAPFGNAFVAKNIQATSGSSSSTVSKRPYAG